MNWQCWQVPVVQQQWQLGLICQSGWTSHAASVPHQPPFDFKNKKGIFLKDIHSNLVCSICDICKFTLSYLHINFLKSLKCSMNLSDIYNLKLTNKYINSMNTFSYGDKNLILTNDMLFDTSTHINFIYRSIQVLSNLLSNFKSFLFRQRVVWYHTTICL